MGEITTIQLHKETRTRLRVWKAEDGMSYDEAINALLDSVADDDE